MKSEVLAFTLRAVKMREPIKAIEELTKDWVIESGFSEPDDEVREYVTSARAHKKQ